MPGGAGDEQAGRLVEDHETRLGERARQAAALGGRERAGDEAALGVETQLTGAAVRGAERGGSGLRSDASSRGIGHAAGGRRRRALV